MIWAIFATIWKSLASACNKKALNFGIAGFAYKSVAYIIPWILGLLFMLSGDLQYMTYEKWLIVSLVLVQITALVLWVSMQQIKREEKISTLLPYTKSNKLGAIAIAFFLYGDTSLTSFLIAMFAVFCLIFFSIDFAEHKIPKNFVKVMGIQVFESFNTVFTGYVLLSIPPIDYYFLIKIIGFVMLFFVVFFIEKSISEYGRMSWGFLKYRGTGFLLHQFGDIVSVFLIVQFGIVISSLLGLLGFVSSLFFSYLLFQDVPSRKNILLWGVIVVSVLAGFYFK